MLTLHQKQTAFSVLLGKLILMANYMGYEVSMGEAWRSDETAGLDAKEGKGISNSLHRLRLAVDICLFKSGDYLTETKDYEPLGTWWKNQSSEDLKCCWGGDFSKPDGNHFSVAHQGAE